MSFRAILLGVILTLCSFAGIGQTVTEPVPQTKSEPGKAESAQNSMKEETVEGFWAVGSYLGNKLVKEVGNRMNLEESKQEKTLTKVKFKVGPFKVERIETR
jgi:hypothetical protein